MRHDAASDGDFGGEVARDRRTYGWIVATREADALKGKSGRAEARGDHGREGIRAEVTAGACPGAAP